MKYFFKITLLLNILIFISCHAILAQQYYNPDALNATTDNKFYIGLASGVESFTGIIGVSLEAKVAKSIALYAGAGIGGWGAKISGGAKLYRAFPYKWAYCVSLSNASGLKDYKAKLETQSGTKDVLMDLRPCQTFNLTAQHHWKMGIKNRFNIEFGLSFALTKIAYTIKDGSVLTPASTTLMEVLQPGGLMAGIGFTFGK